MWHLENAHIHWFVRDRGRDDIAASKHLIAGCTGHHSTGLPITPARPDAFIWRASSNRTAEPYFLVRTGWTAARFANIRRASVRRPSFGAGTLKLVCIVSDLGSMTLGRTAHGAEPRQSH